MNASSVLRGTDYFSLDRALIVQQVKHILHIA